MVEFDFILLVGRDLFFPSWNSTPASRNQSRPSILPLRTSVVSPHRRRLVDCCAQNSPVFVRHSEVSVGIVLFIPVVLLTADSGRVSSTMR